MNLWFRSAVCLLLALFGITSATVKADTLSSRELVSKGMRSREAGRSDSAMLCFSEVAKRYYANPRHKGERAAAAEAFRHMGSICMSTNMDFSKAYEYTATAMAIAEEDGIYGQLPYIYLSMATLWNTSSQLMRHQNSQTAQYLKKAYRTATEHSGANALPMIITDMAVYNMDNGHDYFAKELADFRRRRLPLSTPYLGYCRHYLDASSAMLRADYARAEASFHAAAQTAGSGVKGARCYIEAENKAAEARLAAGDMAGARSMMLANLDYAKKHPGTDDYLYGTYGRLAESYEKAGMSDSAKTYEYLYLREMENLRLKRVPDMREVDFVTKIDRVNGELRQMSLQRQTRERQLIYSLCAGMLLLIVATGSVLAWRSQRRHARELYRQNARLLEMGDRLKTPAEPKTGRQAMEQNMAKDIYDRSLAVLESSDRIYEPGYTLSQLSETLGLKSYIVSQAINEQSGGSFSSLLSAQRVSEAARRLSDPA